MVVLKCVCLRISLPTGIVEIFPSCSGGRWRPPQGCRLICSSRQVVMCRRLAGLFIFLKAENHRHERLGEQFRGRWVRQPGKRIPYPREVRSRIEEGAG